MKLHLLFIVIIVFSACNEVDPHKNKPNIAEETNAKDLSESSECLPGLLYGVAQLDGFKVYLEKSNKSDFEERNAEDFIKFNKTENSDSLEKVLQKRFPDIFYKKDDCYLFHPKNQKQEIIVMNYISPDTKSSGAYKFVGSYKDFILINQEFYEGEGYLVINTTNREVYSFANEPRFMNEQRLYSLGDNYGTTDFQVYDFEEDRYMAIEISNLQGFRPRENYPHYNGSHVSVKFDHSLGSSYYNFHIQENSH